MCVLGLFQPWVRYSTDRSLKKCLKILEYQNLTVNWQFYIFFFFKCLFLPYHCCKKKPITAILIVKSANPHISQYILLFQWHDNLPLRWYNVHKYRFKIGKTTAKLIDTLKNVSQN